MKLNHHVMFGICVLALVLCAAGSADGQQKTTVAQAMKRSSIIFIGTVTKTGAVSFSGVPASRNTLVVRVDRIIDKPGAVSLAEGKDITVAVEDTAAFHVGTRATFYAEGWVVGEGIAVKELAHDLIPAVSSRLSQGQDEARVKRVKQERADAEMKERIDGADMVAVGRVVSVKPLALATPDHRPITEHNPEWQEATITVETGLKGIASGKQVVVRFPASEDVAHYGAPKFKVDQQGVFILKKDTITGTPKAMLGGAQVDAYVVQDRRDVLPKEASSRVRTLMKKK